MSQIKEERGKIVSRGNVERKRMEAPTEFLTIRRRNISNLEILFFILFFLFHFTWIDDIFEMSFQSREVDSDSYSIFVGIVSFSAAVLLLLPRFCLNLMNKNESVLLRIRSAP